MSPLDAESREPDVTGIVVHWHNEPELAALLSAWPRDPRFALCVVDNSGTAGALATDHPWATWVEPGSNLGFGGGVNEGVRLAKSRWVLLLNPDVVVDASALEQLLLSARQAEERNENVAMLAPQMVRVNSAGERVADQFGWQLRPLTKRRHLLAQCFFLSWPKGPRIEPEDGAPVEQPAAAALLVRRDALEQIGGFDERLFPAWFEDVDFAHRLASAGFVGRYARTAEVLHTGGASVPSLGFARFLQIYYRNLQRFARLRGWHGVALVAPPLVAFAALLRLPLLLLRRPKAATSRVAAASAFLQLSFAALTGWRRVDPPATPSGTTKSSSVEMTR